MRLMKIACAAALTFAACLGVASTASASEVWIGGYAHALGTKQREGGFDTQLGIRSDRIESLWWLGKPSIHLLGSVNSEVRTDFVAVGVNYPLHIFPDKRFFIRPGIGIAYTNGEADVGNAFEPGLSASEKARRIQLNATRIDFGSHAVFEPEFALGYHFTPKLSAEISYVHLSNGQILHQGKNQGLDDVGARLTYRFNAR